MMEIKGSQFGIKITEDPDGSSSGLQVQILSEDDGFWHKSGDYFCATWLGDLIRVLQIANDSIEHVNGDYWNLRIKRTPPPTGDK